MCSGKQYCEKCLVSPPDGYLRYDFMKLRAQLSCKKQHSWIDEYKKIQT